MKTITFFSEKGGVGKSSFAIMYASWLKYKHGVKVAIADFNDRITDYRAKELEAREDLMKNNPEIKPYDEKNAWPIVRALLEEVEEVEKYNPVFPYAAWLRYETTRNRLKGYDVVICDFPGSLTGGEFEQNLNCNMLNLTVIPLERETMTIKSTYTVKTLLENSKDQYCIFLNKAKVNLANLRAKEINFVKLMMEELNFRMLPDMVSYSDRMTTIDKPDILRTTFSFPDFDSPTFEGSRDLGIENLFIDVTRLLAETKDLSKTEEADLSFIKELRKTKDNRQFTGSSFPQFEI